MTVDVTSSRYISSRDIGLALSPTLSPLLAIKASRVQVWGSVCPLGARYWVAFSARAKVGLSLGARTVTENVLRSNVVSCNLRRGMGTDSVVRSLLRSSVCLISRGPVWNRSENAWTVVSAVRSDLMSRYFLEAVDICFLPLFCAPILPSFLQHLT